MDVEVLLQADVDIHLDEVNARSQEDAGVQLMYVSIRFGRDLVTRVVF